MSKSSQFEFVVGVNSGYFHENPCATPLTVVANAWDAAAEKLLADGGRYIPVVMHQAKAVYRGEWGCPSGGEDVVVVRGTYNPEFFDFPVQWSAAAMLIAQAVQKALKQTTATLAMTECEFCYMKEVTE